MTEPPKGNRLIVVGASAGGPPALRTLLAGLAADLDAAVLIVQHSDVHGPRVLPSVLESVSVLPVAYAREGDEVTPGRVLLAPPDHHLLVQDSVARVTRGPRQNRSRPSIDVLFRSAAVAAGPGAIGVLLTGMLDDGALGLHSIKRCGGVAVIQDPSDALYPELVEHARENVAVDHCLPLAGIPDLLNRLAQQPAPPDGQIPEDLRLEVEITLDADSSKQIRERVAQPTNYSCPDCGGRLWQTESGQLKHYLCEVGHSYSEKALLEGQDRQIEQALYVALRTLEERARMLERMMEAEKKQVRAYPASSLADRVEEVRANADAIRNLLLKGRQQS
jgi:two-component system chemotaxis response regulator CheB